jgi:hypothetical protein
MSTKAVTEKWGLAGTITLGIVTGAAAALLVAGFISNNESSVSTVRVVGTSQLQQAP